MNKKNAIKLTGVYIQDSESQFTGFFSEFPEAVAQGETIDEAEKGLFEVLPDIMELKKKMAEEDLSENQESANIFKKSYSYELTA